MDEKKDLGLIKFLGQDEQKNYYVQVEIMRDGPNRNRWDFRDVGRLGKSFLGTPILCAYVNHQVGDGHNFREATLPTGEQVLDFTGPTAERIVGAFSDDPGDIWTEEREGQTWLISRGKIWRFYNRQLTDKLARQGSMAVSAEIETFEGYTDDEGIEVYTEWEGLGVTILHESVPPAVPGANIKAIKAMSEEFKKMKFRAASYSGEPEQENIKPKKGGNRNMSLNRREVERLAPLFEGYRIVGLSEDSKRVILMSDSYTLYSYKFTEEFGDEVFARNIKPVRDIDVRCSMDSEDEGVYADLDAIVKNMADELTEQKGAVKNLNEQVATLTESLAKAKEAIKLHRIEMVKDAIKATQAEIEEACDNADVSVSAEAEDMIGRCEEYAGMEAEDGKFLGAEKVKSELYMAFGKKQKESLKLAKSKEGSRYAWEGEKDPKVDDGIMGMLARINP